MGRHRSGLTDDPAGSNGLGQQPQKVTDAIADHLRYEIVAGYLDKDNCPSEAELAKFFGVARPTVREVLRVLEAEGLITLHRGAGGGIRAQAPQVDVATRYVGLLLQARSTTIRDLFLARRAIDPLAARLLAESRNSAAIARLEALVASERAGLADLHAFQGPAVLFYRTVTDACGSEPIAVIGGILQELLVKASEVVLTQDILSGDLQANAERTVADHARLVRLLSTATPARVESFWRSHIDYLESILRPGAGSVLFKGIASPRAVNGEGQTLDEIAGASPERTA